MNTTNTDVKYNYNYIRGTVDKHNFRDICVICLSKFILNEEIFKTNCSHMFHTRCLELWFKENNSCPLCKKKIGKEEFIFPDNRNYIIMNYNLRNYSDNCFICSEAFEYGDKIIVYKSECKVHEHCLLNM